MSPAKVVQILRYFQLHDGELWFASEDVQMVPGQVTGLSQLKRSKFCQFCRDFQS